MNRSARSVRIASFVSTLLAALLATSAAAAGDSPPIDGVPQMLPYQGMLTLVGEPVEAHGEASLHLLFSLYVAPDAEQPIYSQPLEVEAYGGRFTATIGPMGFGPDGEELPFDAAMTASGQLYMGMTMLGDPDDPTDDVALDGRQPIFATPYAMWSTGATQLSAAGQARFADLDVAGQARIDDLDVAGQARIDDLDVAGQARVGALQVDGPIEVPAGSLDLDDLHPATAGRGLVRSGDALNVDEAFLDSRIRSWVRSHCTVRLGWRDRCDNCSAPPAKEAVARADGRCIGASGSNTRCRSNNTWAGVNTDGDVNGDDVFYIRMICN